MLFETDRHEALVALHWDCVTVGETIRVIVADIEAAQLPEGHWPTHPLDSDTAPGSGFKSLYLGSAGVIWALWYLQKQAAVELRVDPARTIEHAARAYQTEPDTGAVVPSYYLGEVGIELVRWCITGAVEAAHRLYASIKGNIAHPSNEALWAAPGTMMAAWHLWEATGEERWRALFAENIEQLWQTWLPQPNQEFYVWTQDLYGHIVQLLGAGHGFAGNLYPLLRGASLLDDTRRAALYQRCLDTLRATGLFEGGRVNWPQGIGTPRPGRTHRLMQWCHGAPGVITSLTYYPPQHCPEMDAMLLAAGEAVWQAGPLSKGYGLCHGTAGNGYALLTLYQRTGDALWLERARSFALHAVAQRENMRAQHGHGRYTLWTGDPGLAVYLWHCLQGTGGLPGLDTLS